MAVTANVEPTAATMRVVFFMVIVLVIGCHGIAGCMASLLLPAMYRLVRVVVASGYSLGQNVGQLFFYCRL